jgi:HemY protein
MRATLWLLAIFSVAVGLALFVGDNDGIVTLFWSPYRFDFSLNLMLLLLMGSFALLYLALRALSALLELPQQAKRWRRQQRERAMHAALRDSLGNLLAGRFSRARKAALSAVNLTNTVGEEGAHAPEVKALAHWMAAEAAQSLQNSSERDQHFQAAMAVKLPRDASFVHEGAQMRAARWALDDRDPHAALSVLNALPQGAQRRTLALRTKLRASRLAHRTPDALETARLLAKHGAFSEIAAQSLVRSLGTTLLNDAHDAAQLQRLWNALPESEKAMPEIALHAAQRLVNLAQATHNAPAYHAVARGWLEGVWNSYASLSDTMKTRLVRTLEATVESIDTAWLSRIESAQSMSPRDGRLQYLAGMACMKRELWGKAQQMLTLCTQDLTEAELKRSAWRALAQLAEHRDDTAGAALAWKKAATIT